MTAKKRFFYTYDMEQCGLLTRKLGSIVSYEALHNEASYDRGSPKIVVLSRLGSHRKYDAIVIKFYNLSCIESRASGYLGSK